MKAEFQGTLISPIQPSKEAVGKRRFVEHLLTQKQRSHHRHISQRKQQRADNTEHQRLCHRSEILSLNAVERQYREEYNQNDEHSKCSGAHHTRRAFLYLLVHLLSGESMATEFLPIDMRQNALKNHDR